jgi:phosphoheptose isomerase
MGARIYRAQRSVNMKSIQDEVAQFRDTYADRLAVGLSEYVSQYGQQFFQSVEATLKRRRSVIYIFGNGGCHAIAQCLKYALESYAADNGLPARIRLGVDVHEILGGHEPGIAFTQILRTEGADEEDLVILISGSGDSDNLRTTARYAVERQIPTLALLGSYRGKINDVLPAERCYVTPLDDQQISEDLIQSFAYLFDLSRKFGPDKSWSPIVSERAENFRQAIRRIPASFLDRTADLVVEAFEAGRLIWVLGLDHPALSATAEHTAHNLYWDSIYEVLKPPPRLISSSPTACNFSGISNDRRRGILRNITGIPEIQIGGLALVYAINADSSACEELLSQCDRFEIPICFFGAKEPEVLTNKNWTTYATGLQDPQLQAGLSQIFGHMLGRLVRLKLLERERSQNVHLAATPAQFLIDFDLAQRRLLE